MYVCMYVCMYVSGGGPQPARGPTILSYFFLLKSSELSNDIRINLLALHNGLKQLCATKASIIAGQVGDH